MNVLVYPGWPRAIPSARLEQLRDGIEDWAVFDVVRARYGAARVRSILGGAGLFSADAGGVHLACHLGCELRSATKYSWPLWSHDATTPARIEAAHLQALQAAAGRVSQRPCDPATRHPQSDASSSGNPTSLPVATSLSPNV